VDIGQCFVAQGAKTPAAGPASKNLVQKQVVRAFSVTTGNMLRSPAAQ